MKRFRVNFLEKTFLCSLFGQFNYRDKRKSCYSYKWYLSKENLKNFTNEVKFPLNDKKIEVIKRNILRTMFSESYNLYSNIKVKVFKCSSRWFKGCYSLRILIYR